MNRASATSSRSSPPRRRRSIIWTTPPPARSAAPPPKRCGISRPPPAPTSSAGVYRLADAATAAFHKARAEVAAYIGAADADEVVFTSGCTLAINTAAHALAARLRPGDEILVSRARASQQPRAVADGGASAPARSSGRSRSPKRAASTYDRLDELVSRAHAGDRGHPRLERHRCADRGRAPARRRRRRRAPCCCSTAPSGRRTARSTCRRWAATCTRSRPTRCSGRPVPARLWVRSELLAELPPFLGGGEMIRRVTIERLDLRAAAASLRGRHAADRRGDRHGCGRGLARHARLGGAGPAGDRADRQASWTASAACPASGCRAQPARRRGSAWSRSASRAPIRTMSASCSTRAASACAAATIAPSR